MVLHPTITEALLAEAERERTRLARLSRRPVSSRPRLARLHRRAARPAHPD